MLSSARTAALILIVLAAGAAPARADERCTGTLCDLYYGGPPPEPAPGQAADTAPKPLMAPSIPTISGGGILGKFFGGGSEPAAGQTVQSGTQAATPASRPLVAVQGGGLVGPRSQADAPCTGTLCDLYYGTSTKWSDEEKAAGAVPAPAAPAPAAEEAVADEAPAAPTHRAEVRYATPRCAAPAGDPWHCYR